MIVPLNGRCKHATAFMIGLSILKVKMLRSDTDSVKHLLSGEKRASFGQMHG